MVSVVDMVFPFHNLRRSRPSVGYTFGITLKFSPVVHQDSAPLLHLSPESLACAVQSDFGGTGRQVKDGGDLPDIQILEFAQAHDGPVRQRQGGHHVIDAVAHLILDRGLPGVGLSRRDGVSLFYGSLLQCLVVGCTPDPVQGQIGRDLKHPGGNLAFPAEPRKPLVHPKENLLGQILSLRTGHEPVQKGYDPGVEGGMERIEILNQGWGGGHGHSDHQQGEGAA